MASDTIRQHTGKSYNTCKGTLNNKILEAVKSGFNWWRKQTLDETHAENMAQDSNIDDEDTPLQDLEAKPVLFGSDVVGLYPNLDNISVAAIAASAVENTGVKFKKIRYSLYFIF